MRDQDSIKVFIFLSNGTTTLPKQKLVFQETDALLQDNMIQNCCDL